MGSLPEDLERLLDKLSWMSGANGSVDLSERFDALTFDAAVRESMELSELSALGMVNLGSRRLERERRSGGWAVGSDGGRWFSPETVDTVRYPAWAMLTTRGRSYFSDRRKDRLSKLGWSVLTAALGGLFALAASCVAPS